MVITILNPEISLRGHKEDIFLVKLILERSGLLFYISNKLPSDVVFTFKPEKYKSIKYIVETKKIENLKNIICKNQKIKEPLIEQYIVRFLNNIIKIFPDKWAYFSQWKNSSPYAVAPSHDVDRTRYYSLTNFFRNFFKKEHEHSLNKKMYYLFHPKKDPIFNLLKLPEMEAKNGIFSTFFFLTVKRDKHGRRYDLRQYKKIIQNLNSSGWEVGLHGSLKAKQSLDRLIYEKNKLENILENRIEGMRYHYLLNKNFVLENSRISGFFYDSSLSDNTYQVLNNGISTPFLPWDKVNKKKIFLYEVPVNASDMVLIRGGKICEEFLNKIKNVSGLITLLWHQRMFSSIIEKNIQQSYWDIIYKAQKENAWISPINDIVRFYNARVNIRHIPHTNYFRSFFDINSLDFNISPSHSSISINGKGSFEKLSKTSYRLNLFKNDILQLS